MADTAKSARRKSQLAITVALLAIPLIYFYPAVLGNVILAPGDGWSQNLGVRVLIGQLLRAGELPLWNPFIFAGMPLAASVYPGAFYPPNWVFAVLPPQWAMNLVVITTYHLALIGTYLYARRIGVARVGALLAGIAFAFGGFMINHLSHTSRIAAAAWLPWILLALESIAQSDSWRQAWRWSVLGALFIALQFVAGEPQMVAFTVIVAAPCALFALWQGAHKTARLRCLAGLALMAVCGVLFTLPQLLPSLELLTQSERNDPGPLFFDTFSFPPRQLPGLLIPYFFGGASMPPYRVPYWGTDNAAVNAGYVGMLTWLLALAAIVRAGKNRRVWLWLGIAAGTLVLAFGGYLPFELNHLLYRIPGYKAFRGSYRHHFEFTFALAMLGGLGANVLLPKLEQLGKQFQQNVIAAINKNRWRDETWPLVASTFIATVLLACAGLLYLSYGNGWVGLTTRPAGAASATNAEFWIPLLCFVVSVAAFWFAYRSQAQAALPQALLVCVLLLDLASYGHFFFWRGITFDVKQRLADPPAVAFIKERETNLNAFRVMSYPVQFYDYAFAWPDDPNFELVNEPNVSIVRGLQSLSGYDVLRPLRMAEIAGTVGGVSDFAQDLNSFSVADRGFDLLNLKYLIVGRGGPTGKKPGYTYDGVYFARSPFRFAFAKGVQMTSELDGVWADEIAFVSTMGNSTHLPDGAPVLHLRLHTRDGQIRECDLQMGRHTSEWAYERPDVRDNAKHSKAKVVERNATGEGFDALLYLGRVPFPRGEIVKIEWSYPREDANLAILRASLHDNTTGASIPLENVSLPKERWQLLKRADQIEVYENRHALPRAWFVNRVMTQPPAATLKTIHSGQLPDGTPFDPRAVALLAEELSLPVADAGQSAKAELKSFAANRLVIETQTTAERFLVISEIAYDGWQARLDGKPHTLYRTDHTLRGLVVPAGAHTIELVYRPRSFRRGIWLAGGGIGLLLLAVVLARRLDRQ